MPNQRERGSIDGNVRRKKIVMDHISGVKTSIFGSYF